MCSFVHEMFKIVSVSAWGSAPDPGGGAYDAPPDPLVVRGFLPSAIAASRLRRLQFFKLGRSMIQKIQLPTFFPTNHTLVTGVGILPTRFQTCCHRDRGFGVDDQDAPRFTRIRV